MDGSTPFAGRPATISVYRPDFSQTPVFRKGAQAFAAGQNQCPYASRGGYSMSRYQWWSGWLDARVRKNCPLSFPED